MFDPELRGLQRPAARSLTTGKSASLSAISMRRASFLAITLARLREHLAHVEIRASLRRAGYRVGRGCQTASACLASPPGDRDGSTSEASHDMRLALGERAQQRRSRKWSAWKLLVRAGAPVRPGSGKAVGVGRINDALQPAPADCVHRDLSSNVENARSTP